MSCTSFAPSSNFLPVPFGGCPGSRATAPKSRLWEARARLLHQPCLGSEECEISASTKAWRELGRSN